MKLRCHVISHTETVNCRRISNVFAHEKGFLRSNLSPAQIILSNIHWEFAG